MTDCATTNDNIPIGTIFDIQKFSIHDGPGIRTTVFMKGCPLRCLWCHNPESYERRPQVSFNPALCIGCGACAERCEHGAHKIADGQHVIDRAACVECFSCLEKCYSRALEPVGKEMTVEEVIAEVVKDKAFYEQSGGGITLSGGEPMSQFAFTKALLEASRAEEMHTCMETCGIASADRYRELMPLVDLFLYDIKEIDADKHTAATGQSNELVLENLRMLDAAGASIELRCPIIPGVNQRADHLQGIADLAASMKNSVTVAVMGYHRLGESKRERVGLKPPSDELDDIPSMTKEETDGVRERLKALGCENVK